MGRREEGGSGWFGKWEGAGREGAGGWVSGREGAGGWVSGREGAGGWVRGKEGGGRERVVG